MTLPKTPEAREETAGPHEDLATNLVARALGETAARAKGRPVAAVRVAPEPLVHDEAAIRVSSVSSAREGATIRIEPLTTAEIETKVSVRRVPPIMPAPASTPARVPRDPDLPVYVENLVERVDALINAELRSEVLLVIHALGSGMVPRRPTEMHAYLAELEARVNALRSGELKFSELAAVAPPPPRAPVIVPPPDLDEAPRPEVEAARPVRVIPRRTPAPVLKSMMKTKKKKKTPKYLLFLAKYWARYRRALMSLLWLLLALLLLWLMWWLFNLFQDYRTTQFAKATLRNMVEAPSYRSSGEDTTTTPASKTHIVEDFAYVSPQMVRTNFKVLSGKVATTSCRDLTIVVLGKDRYQECQDSTNPSKWRKDTIEGNVFDTALIRPFMRFLWCKDIKVQEQPEMLDGVPHTVYNCTVKNEREAEVIWDKRLPLGEGTAADKKRFIKEAKVDIKLWQEPGTGYIAKFYMMKKFPSAEGQAVEEVLYTYFDFKKVPAIQKPI